MAGKVASELKAKTDAAWTNLTRQLQGMESHLDRSDASGQWTTREVLSHLLFQPGWDPTVTLKSFAPKTLPVIDMEPGKPYLNAVRFNFVSDSNTRILAVESGTAQEMDVVPFSQVNTLRSRGGVAVQSARLPASEGRTGARREAVR